MPPTVPPVPPASPELSPDAGAGRLTLRAGRHGEMEHHELVHLLDSLDDDRSKSRFRESIYISIIIYLALAWFVFYGPKVLFHQGRIVNPADVLKQRDKQLTYLDLPKDLTKLPKPKNTKALSDHDTVAQTSHPSLDKKTLEQLQAMRRAGAPSAPPPPPPSLPAAPQPQQAAPQQQTPPQPTPLAQRPAQSAANIPDAPRPSQSTRPNFSTPTNPGTSIQNAANAAAASAARGQGGENGQNRPRSHQGLNTGVEVLSDTLGTDFGPYIKRIIRLIQNAWEPLIPEECDPPLYKEGTTLIRVTIRTDGVVSFMHLDGSTHDVAIDKAAWGGITGVGQFPPLPKDFKGEDLALRFQFNTSRRERSGVE